MPLSKRASHESSQCEVDHVSHTIERPSTSSRLLAASAVSLESSGRYVVVFSAERVPVDFGERVAALGGSIESRLDSIGVAAVTGLSEAGAAELAANADIRAVEPDPLTRPRDDGEAVDGLADEAVSEAVASAVASNASVLAGVNRYVTLLAVKVADSTNTHTVGRIISGIVYAADQGADVINVSRGSQRDRRLDPGTVVAYERAVNYAFRKGALVVSVPFNDAADLDHNGDIVRLPCEAANAICAAATGPTGASGINGPWENVDAPAPYTAFGRSAISVAAPGGTGNPGQFRRFWALCTTTPSLTTTVPPACRAHQPIVQGAGTSFAAPTVAGLAALLVAQLGHGNPALIRARILQSADDLGEPGVDPYYGKGRINIARALGLIP